ncbi:galectin-2-like [Acipenser oxyrinchus oxyrinchus]|uniref:Galectin n=1 Tax=Acipenser oxyrinchus oxyrinchus TaxID=40147 RepID=A0AAD8FNH0_ACIOX|nr:galectin-2-like [Acipenser oxyrinchus oxyrinchus]
MGEVFEVKNVDLKVGDKMKIKGKIADDAKRFCLDMGKDSEELGLHFNPRFHDDVDGAVIVCNSKHGGCWGSEQRDPNFPFQKGEIVKFTVKVLSDCFEIELPSGHIVAFPNHLSLDKISYIRVKGDFKVTSFKFD